MVLDRRNRFVARDNGGAQVAVARIVCVLVSVEDWLGVAKLAKPFFALRKMLLGKFAVHRLSKKIWRVSEKISDLAAPSRMLLLGNTVL